MLLQEECSALTSKLSSTLTENESLKTSAEETGKKQEKLEKHFQAAEEDNVQLADAVSQLREQLQSSQLEQRQLEHLLEEHRLQFDGCRMDFDQLKQQSMQREEEFNADMKKLTNKLKHAEHERKLARKALKLQEDVDGKGMDVQRILYTFFYFSFSSQLNIVGAK